MAALGVLGAAGLGACSTSTLGGVDAGAEAGRDATPTPDGSGLPEASVDAATDDASLPDSSHDDAALPDAGPDTSVLDASVDAADAADAAIPPMTLTSATLTNGGRFPAVHTCSGVNQSPALSWTAGPPGTLSYAIVMKDLTVPNIHWTLYNIPASTLSVGASVPVGFAPGAPAPAGSRQAGVTFSPSTLGYLGPCPPSGDHLYVFTVHALTGATVAGVSLADTPEVIEGQILAQQVAGGSATLSSSYTKP